MLLSITATIVDKVTAAIGDNGVPMVFVLMTLESACIPVPSEVIQLFAGFLVGQGQMGFVAAVAAGTLGNVLGSWIAWWIGYHGGRPLILRYGRFFHVTPKRMALADRWFDVHGNQVVFWSRMVPVVRTFISLPAGVARMPFARFTLYTFLGALIWCTLLTLLGVKVGENWDTWHDRLAYLDYLVGLVVLAGVIWLIIRIRRDRLPDEEPV